jgi:hypothetical protein
MTALTWVYVILSVYALLKAYHMGLCAAAEQESRRAPRKRIDWVAVYQMECEVYGHTFTHIGAPEPRPLSMSLLAPNERRTLADVSDHIQPLSSGSIIEPPPPDVCWEAIVSMEGHRRLYDDNGDPNRSRLRALD